MVVLPVSGNDRQSAGPKLIAYTVSGIPPTPVFLYAHGNSDIISVWKDEIPIDGYVIFCHSDYAKKRGWEV